MVDSNSVTQIVNGYQTNTISNGTVNPTYSNEHNATISEILGYDTNTITNGNIDPTFGADNTASINQILGYDTGANIPTSNGNQASFNSTLNYIYQGLTGLGLADDLNVNSQSAGTQVTQTLSMITQGLQHFGIA
jgi:hypothetical protein